VESGYFISGHPFGSGPSIVLNGLGRIKFNFHNG